MNGRDNDNKAIALSSTFLGVERAWADSVIKTVGTGPYGDLFDPNNGYEFGNSAKIIVPRSWLARRVIAFLHSEYISKHPEERKADE